MSVLKPDDLFDQAERLLQPTAGLPRQADVRRAISAAYYGVFHHVLTAAADLHVQGNPKPSKRYTLLYRSIDHAALRRLCEEAKKQTPSAKYRKYVEKGLGPNIQAFASAFLDLQEKRHEADYDPLARMKISDARVAIATARSAIQRFNKAPGWKQRAFLTLLLFPPR